MRPKAVETAPDSIAVVGMAGRFPGAATLDLFWDNVRRRVESITTFSDDDARRRGLDPARLAAGRFVFKKPTLDGEDLFDARFFGYAPDEAELIDPQQRLFLECAWEALERAGCVPERYPGVIGLFAGSSQNTYLWHNLLAKPGLLERLGVLRVVTASGPDFLATRAGYKLNLTGPCINVQTACSTALVAVHLACQALNNIECDVALAGAVTLTVSPFPGYFYEPGSMLSPDGHCRPFDARAGGTVFGDGLGVVVLKRLDDAIADGDTIHALIRGSAVNNDGAAKAGFTAVGAHGQASLIFQALDSAGVAADSISYIEAHGSGTPIGDAIEIKALTTAFRSSSKRTAFCGLGSVKGNIGHLLGVAGAAGLIKTVLALERCELPPSGNFETLHPDITLAGSPFFIVADGRPWPRGSAPRRAGITAFGMGGTNAHVILEEAPLATPSPPSARNAHLVVLSARTAAALGAARARLAAYLRARTDLNLADVAFTLQTGRRGFEHRFCVSGSSVSEVVRALERPGPSGEPAGEQADVARRWLAGGDVDWAVEWHGERRRRIPLPTYPFERQRYWSQVAPPASHALPGGAAAEPAAPASASRASRPMLAVPFCAPSTATEHQVAQVWSEMLRLEHVGIDDQFFELGGDSLVATRLANRLRALRGRNVGMRDIVAYPTVRALSARLEELAASAPVAAPMERRPVSSASLSFAQVRLWFLDRMEPGSPAYNLPLALRFDGPVETEWVRRALQIVVERHESLRTTFSEVDGQPMQVIAQEVNPHLEVIELDGLAVERHEAEVARLAAREFLRPFDLAAGPLLRTTLVRGQDGSVLLFTTHHIVSDGWSLDLFAREFIGACAAIALGREPDLWALPIQYSDFAHWQLEAFGEDEQSRQLRYWKGELAGLPTLDLPTDLSRPPEQTFRGAVRNITIDTALAGRVRQLARTSNTTVFAVMLAAFAAVLHRYTRHTDLAIGSPVANRSRQETERLIGLFVNTVVLRVRCTGGVRMRNLVAAVADTVQRAQDHQDLPFEQLVEALQPPRDLGRNPLFQVMFAHVKPSAPDAGAPAPVQALDLSPGLSRFDLTCTVQERGEVFFVQFEYAADLFHAATIERLGRYFEQVLQAVVRVPDTLVSDLPVPDRLERDTTLRVWNDTARPPGRARTLAAALDDAVRRRGDRDAILCGGERISYAELDRRSSSLAATLRAAGVVPGELVGVYLPRSIDLVVALAAVTKAGGAYVPLDPGLPEDRLAIMAADARPIAMVSCRALSAASLMRPFHVVTVEDSLSERPPVEGAPLELQPEHLAYVLYTSGSTGTPKGVQISHAALMNFLEAMRRCPGLTASDRLVAVTTISFDIAGLELWLPLTTGATVVLATRDDVADPCRLARLLDESGATVMQATPATWRLLQDTGWTNPSGVRVLVGGEALPADLARYLRSLDVPVWNLYGPTETTVWSTLHDVTDSERATSIGRPIANTRAYVLDDRLSPVPINTPGDLYLAGAGLARGYLHQPAATAARFLPDPFAVAPGSRMYATGDLARFRRDGTLEFLGRVDDQVKLHGHRIELGEIEHALSSHRVVRQVVVARREDTPGDPRLVAYVVPTAGHELAAAELRSHASRALAEYMVPSRFVAIDQVPLTPSGKIDRSRLPAPDRTDSRPPRTLPAPRSDEERRMTAIWRRCLSVDQIGPDDDFFELGGHSMLAAKLIAAVRREFDVDLPLRLLFLASTVASLSRLVTHMRLGGSLAAILQEGTGDLRRDAVLASDIAPEGAPPDPGPPAMVLLTGATGFLGAFLLHELLAQTAATVVCLVRAASPAEGLDRLERVLSAYDRWQPGLAGRIRVVCGDVSEPRFGLTFAEYERLAADVDVIYHNGALVNFTQSYRRLRPVNVAGTEEVIRLACRTMTKTLHYVSTMDVLGGSYYTTGEEDPIDGVDGWGTGYAQSKWVAEQLVSQARSRGLPAAIYRPARIVGDRATGRWNTDDFGCRAIKGLVQLGYAPRIDPIDNMSPVDHVALTIVTLSRNPAATSRRAFHVLDPRWFEWQRMFAFIRRRGYALAEVPYAEWWTRLADACTAGDDNALKPLFPLFPPPPEPRIDGPEEPPAVFVPPTRCENTLAALGAAGITYPSIDDDLLGRYFDGFVRSGFLQPTGTEVRC